MRLFPRLEKVTQFGMSSYATTGGLTKRELYAVMAMQAQITSSPNAYPGRRETAERAIQYADALIAELEKPKEAGK